MAGVNSLIYKIQILGTDTAKLSVEELIDRQKQLKELLTQIPATSTKAYKELKRQVEDANGATKTLEKELEDLKQQYRDSLKTIKEFNKGLEDSSKAEERLARSAELAAQRKLDAEQRKSDKVLQNLRDAAEQQRRIELQSSQDGLATLRQEEIDRLQAQHEFSLLSDKEQEQLINKINARYDRESEKLATKQAKENPAVGSTNELRQRLIALNKELDNTAHEIDGKVNPAFVELTQRSRELTHQVAEAEQASGRFQRNVGNYPDIGQSIKDTFANIGPSLIGAFAIGNVADLAVQGLQSVIAVGTKFEATVSNLSAITGATGPQLEYLSDKAKELGVSSTLGASQTAEAFKIIGSASPSLLKSGEALAGVTEQAILLSQASGDELPATAASLTTVLNQFAKAGETATEQVARATKAVDILAAGSQAGAAEVGDLAESMKKAGVPANALGLDLATTVGALETLADKTIKAEVAGTGFKGTLIALAKNGIGMKDGVLDLNAALEQLAPIQNDVAALTKLFGSENLVTAQTLIQNREQVIRYTEAVSESGVAMEQARINMDNLAGDSKKLDAALEGIQLTIFDQIGKDARDSVQGVTALVEYLSVGLKDGLDDLLAPAQSVFDTFKSLFVSLNGVFKVFGQAGKEGNAFGTVLKVLGATLNFALLPFKAIVYVATALFDNFRNIAHAIQDFIADSPKLSAAIDKLLIPLNFFKDALGAVGDLVGSVFSGPEVKSNTAILVSAFGSLENAARALRTELGASKEEYDGFIKGFDKKLIEGKGIDEARQIVEQSFNEYLKVARQAQGDAASESLQALQAQLTAEETLKLEQSVKGLEILKKRKQQELQAEEGFSKLSKGQQLILLEKISREYEEKKRALNKSARTDEMGDALKALRERIEAEKLAALQGTEEGLELARQAAIKKQEQEKGFGKLAVEEQAVLLQTINDEYDKKIRELGDRNAEERKKTIASGIEEVTALIQAELEQRTAILNAQDLQDRQALDAREQEELDRAGNNLGRRLRIQEKYNLERRDLEMKLQEDLLQVQIEAITKQLQVADLEASQILALEYEQQQLRAQLYDLDREAQAQAEADKRAQLEKTREAQKQVADGLIATTSTITGIIQAGADERIASIKKLDDAQKAQTEAEIARINKEYDTRRLQLESSITNQAALAQALSNLEARKDAALAQAEGRAAKEKEINDKAVQEEQERKQKALAFQKKVEAVRALVENAAIIRAGILAITKNAADNPFPLNLVAIVSTIAAIAAGLASMRTLTQSYDKFEEGGEVTGVPERRQGRGGLHRGPRHRHGGIKIEVEGGEYEVNREGTRMFLPLIHWMNEQGLRKMQGKRYSSDPAEAMRSMHVPLPMPRPAYRFQSGGVTPMPQENTRAIQSGVGDGVDKMVTVLERIERGQQDMKVTLSLPELGRAQVRSSGQETRTGL